MMRKILNIAIGGLAVLNLIAFGILAGPEPGSAEPVDCNTQFCECKGPGMGLPEVCLPTTMAPPYSCRYHDDCS